MDFSDPGIGVLTIIRPPYAVSLTRPIVWYCTCTIVTLCRYSVCPGLDANEIQIPYDKHPKVSSLVKRHQNTHNSVKYEVI